MNWRGRYSAEKQAKEVNRRVKGAL